MSTIQSALTAAVNGPANKNGGSISLNDLVQMGRDGGLPDSFVSGLKDKGLKHNEILTMIVSKVAQTQRTAALAAPATPPPPAPAAAAVPPQSVPPAQSVVARVASAPASDAAELARLRAENAKLLEAAAAATAAAKARFTMRISEAGFDANGKERKGGVMSIYTGGKFPVNLFRDQVVKIVGDPHDPNDSGRYHEIRAFVLANWDKFRTKP